MPRTRVVPQFPSPGQSPQAGRSLPTVAVLLPRRLQIQARLALGRGTEVLGAGSWEELERLIKDRPLRAVIVDPGMGGAIDAEWVVSLFTRYPSLPVIAYVTLDPASFSAVARLSRFGLEHVILHGFDDSVDRFKTVVESGTADPLVHRVMDGLRSSLGQLPLALSIALKDMFNEPHRYHTAIDLNAESGISTLRMYLSFKAANLASPKRFVIAARALRAYSYLRDPGYLVRDVSVKLGYCQARILTSHSMMVFGLTLARASDRLSEREAVKRVLKFVRGQESAAVRNTEGQGSSRGVRRGRANDAVRRAR